jgi:hypothetical protein
VKTGGDPNEFVEVRLIDDMAPFHFQIEAAWHHAGVPIGKRDYEGRLRTRSV